MASDIRTVPPIAMIMAAGYGTRMRPLTDALPKPLLKLSHLSIIDVVLHRLSNQGIKQVVVNSHFLPEKMQAHLGNGQQYGLNLMISKEEVILGSGGGIANAERYFKGETILAANADVLTVIEVADLYTFHQSVDSMATMACLPSRNNRDYTLVIYDSDANFRGVLRRNQEIPAGMNSGIFTGYQVLTPQARSYLKAIPQSIITEFYMRALAENRPAKVYEAPGPWIDIGTKEFYESFVEDIRSGEVSLEPFM